MKKIINLVLLVIAMACFESQAAWDGSVTGAIDRIEVTNGGNYGFRVLLKETSTWFRVTVCSLVQGFRPS